MRLLFEIDMQDYGKCTHCFVRNSARSIIIAGKKVAMVHSKQYDYYKFPGGGIEKDESPVDAMIRETREEAGLVVKPETVKAYGYVHRIQKSDRDETECFVQDSFYFLCEVEAERVSQNLDDYEAREDYTLEFVEPQIAVRKNRREKNPSCDWIMLDREAAVLELLLAEQLLE